MSGPHLDVWVCALSGVDHAAMAALLSEDEWQRARRFHFDRHRNQFIATRGILRTLLSRYLQCDPRALRFELGPNGKPMLPDRSAFFNVSHSGDLAVVALSRSHECGVDVEELRVTPDLDSIAQRFFSREECRALSRLSGAARTNAFFRCWTRKEAIVKATGIGLSLSLQSFDVPIDSDALPCITPVHSERWWLHDVPVPPGYAAALAVAGEHAVIRFHEWV